MLPRSALELMKIKASAVSVLGGEIDLRVMKAYMCLVCGFIYEEEKGDAQSGIPPNTKWEDVPLSWRCPDCGAGKEDFEMIEI